MNNIALKITNKCDKNCSHCCENSCMNGKSMKFSLVKEIFKKLPKTITDICFTGGEALLYKDCKYNFLDIYKLTVKHKIKCHIMTGGMTDDLKYRNIIKKLKNVNFYLSFNLFKKNNKEFFITAINLISNSKNKIQEINIAYIPENKKETINKFKAIRYVLDEIKAIETNTCIIQSVGRGANLIIDFFTNYCSNSCIAGRIVTIDIDGRIFPCCSIVDRKCFNKFNYNIKKDNLIDVFKESKLFCEIVCLHRL